MEINGILIIVLLLSCQILILFFSIVLHEFGHGYTAYKLGDPTAKRMGRLTLNPAKHIDPLGSLVFLITLGLTILNILPLPIGWAKPVMVDFRYFSNPRKCMALVAIMGPMMNLALAALFLLAFFILDWIPQTIPMLVGYIMVYGVFINLLLATINLLPIPPLDGSNIVAGFLPWRFTILFYKMRYFGIGILLIMIFSIGEDNLLMLVSKFYELFGIAI
ncbi:site-2 protease family protein [bacterium]|nr:site-2 protease family protein [bacterium]